MNKISCGLSVKYQLFLSDFNKTWIFSTILQKMLKYNISWKSELWEPRCSMWTEGLTDSLTDGQDEANSRFSQFCGHA
jgi:hypothetical protein